MAALQSSFAGAKIALPSAQPVRKAPARSVVSPIAGTRVIKQVKVLEPFADKKGTLRSKIGGEASDVKLLSRVQELRLLSKAEESGLLSLLESLGFSLSAIESAGLLSKAESLGLFSLATDPSTPSKLLGAALVLLAAGPATAYFVPEDSGALVFLQIVVALVSVLGGSAAFGASQLIATLQK